MISVSDDMTAFTAIRPSPALCDLSAKLPLLVLAMHEVDLDAESLRCRLCNRRTDFSAGFRHDQLTTLHLYIIISLLYF